MSRLNTSKRGFNTVYRTSTIIHPEADSRHTREFGVHKSDTVTVRTIDTRGAWPISYMLPDEQLVHLAVLANHINPRKGHRG